MGWIDDPQDRAPFTEAVDTIADLTRQLAEAREGNRKAIDIMTEGIQKTGKELFDAREEITRLRKIFQAVIDFDPPEICKDEFAYDRLKEAYRTAAKAALEASDV